jgi:tRNA G18 (ribose-2'-O)-methylase SpoU
MSLRKLKLEELGRPSIKDFKAAKKFPVVYVLDNVRSALNVGSIFRTADALGIEKLCLCGITAHPPHKEILKTAIGATASVKWSHESNVVKLAKQLKSNGFQLIGIEQTNQSIELQHWTANIDKPHALFFGNEVDGLSPELLPFLDCAVEIPQFGTKHSFNVAVTAGIVGWHLIAQTYLDKE